MQAAPISQMGLWLGAVPPVTMGFIFVYGGDDSIGCCFLLVSLPL
jgi:hypothetical protein